MTEGRLSRFLFSHVLATSGGDLSATAIITGNDVPLSRVKLFYACPSVSRLQSLYTTAVTDLRDQMWSSLGQTPPSHTTATLKKTANHRESPLSNPDGRCKTAIRTLKDEISRSEKPRTASEHQRHHNLENALYTMDVLLHYWRSGYRHSLHRPLRGRPGTSADDLGGRRQWNCFQGRLVQLTLALCKQIKVDWTLSLCLPPYSSISTDAAGSSPTTT